MTEKTPKPTQPEDARPLADRRLATESHRGLMSAGLAKMLLILPTGSLGIDGGDHSVNIFGNSGANLVSNAHLPDGVNWEFYDPTHGATWLGAQLDGLVWFITAKSGANPPAWVTNAQLMGLSDDSFQIKALSKYLMLMGNTGTYIGGNAYWDGAAWQRYNTASGAALVAAGIGSVTFFTAPAAANPVTWTLGPQVTSQGLLIPNGSIASPSIALANFPSTGLYGGAGPSIGLTVGGAAVFAAGPTAVHFYTGGAERMYVDSTNGLSVPFAHIRCISGGHIYAYDSTQAKWTRTRSDAGNGFIETNGANLYINNASGVTGVQTQVMNGAGAFGTINAAVFHVSSSQTVKGNIALLADDDAPLSGLQPKTYTLDGDPSGTTYTGFVAEDVRAVYPDAVAELTLVDDNGNSTPTLGVDIIALQGITVSALRRVIARLKAAIDRIVTLETQVQGLNQARLNQASQIVALQTDMATVKSKLGL